MERNYNLFITMIISTSFWIFLCTGMSLPRPAEKGWSERAGKALARTGRFAVDEWWNGSHVPSILRECEQAKFDRDLTEKDGRLNISNFESALIELIQKRKAEDLTFVLEKGIKMKSFKDSSHATILQEINTQRLQEAKDIISIKEATIADTTVAEINTLIADRSRQMDEMRRLKKLISNGFIETRSPNSEIPSSLFILQKLQQSPQFCTAITSSSSLSPTALGVATAAALSSSTAASITSTSPSSSSSSPSTAAMLVATALQSSSASSVSVSSSSSTSTSGSLSSSPFSSALSASTTSPALQTSSSSVLSSLNDTH